MDLVSLKETLHRRIFNLFSTKKSPVENLHSPLANLGSLHLSISGAN